MADRSLPTPRPGAGLGLSATHWKHLDGRCRSDRPDLVIDRVLVGPSGIVAVQRIDALRSDQPAAAAAVVASVLPARYHDRVRAMLLLPGDQPRAEEVAGLTAASGVTLEHIVRASPVVLSTSEVAEVVTLLERRLDVVPDQRRGLGRSRAWRRAVAVAAAAAVVAAAAAAGPDVMELARSL